MFKGVNVEIKALKFSTLLVFNSLNDYVWLA